MKTIIGIILESIRARLTLACYIAITLGIGFLLVYANSQLELVLNDYLLVRNFNGFAFRLLLTVGLFTLVFGLSVLGAYLTSNFHYSSFTQLMKHYIGLLLRAKNSYFTNRPSADIFMRLFESSDGVAYFASTALRLASYSITFVFYGIIIFRLNLFAGIFAVLVTPLYFLATKKAGDRISDLLQDRLERTAELSTVTQEAFENIGNVKAKGAYAFFTGRPVSVLHIIKSIMVRSETLLNYIQEITTLVRIIAPLLIIFAAMWFSPDFSGGAGKIMMLYINIPLFLITFSNIHNQYIAYKAMKPLISQLQEFNDVELESESGIEVTAFESLKAERVKVTFDGGRVVSVPDFEIKKGEKVMLFGESGAGKSTLFNIIMGLITDYEGDVYVNGINLREISLASVRRIFGITFQHTNALTLNLRDNILLGASIPDEKLEKLIQLTALENQHDEKGDALLNNKVLSGGEKSRLGLSQKLVADPEIMLIDEAFSNMDEALESKILSDLFREYPDRAVICISHRNASRPFFDRVVEFDAFACEAQE
jgi:ABC-type bacteriocin/lantibiotic exporter with double-glycine peptidase domain